MSKIPSQSDIWPARNGHRALTVHSKAAVLGQCRKKSRQVDARTGSELGVTWAISRHFTIQKGQL
jgi:hypothetical protein